MSFLDFTPLRRQLDPGDLLDPVLSELRLRAQRRAAEETQARQIQAQRDQQASQIQAGKERQGEQLRFNREQEDRLSARDQSRHESSMARLRGIDERDRRSKELEERRLTGKMTLDNQKQRQEREGKIRSAAAAGDFATAEGLGDYSEVDPSTGEVRGMKLFERLNGVPTPVTRELGEGVEGPQISLEDAEGADYIRGDMAQAENEKNPRLRVGNVETTQGDLRYAQGRQNAADLQGQRAILEERLKAAGDPYQASVIQRQLNRLEQLTQGVSTGAVPLKSAMDDIGKAGIRDEAEEFKARQGDLNRASAEKRTGMMAARPRMGQELAEKRLGLSERKEQSANLRRDVKTTVDRWNAKTTQEAAFEFPNIIKMLDSGNGKLQNQALITMMRLAQKDNRFSDADAKLAMQSGAGWLGQVESWFSKGASGELGPDVIQAARQAAQVLNGFYQNKTQQMNDDLMSFVSNPMDYDPREAEQLLRREFPGFGAALDTKRGKQPGATQPPVRRPAGDETMRVMPGKLPGAAEAAAMELDDPNDTSPLPEDPEAASIDDEQPTLEQLLAEKKRRQAMRGR